MAAHAFHGDGVGWTRHASRQPRSA